MIKGKIAYIILGIIFFVALVIQLFSLGGNWVCVNGAWIKHGRPNSSQPTNLCPGVQIINNQNSVTSTPVTIVTSTPTSTEPNLNTGTAQVIIETPQPGMVISSPLVIKGQARGNWFFEASLPVKLLDDKGQTIASAPAQAEGEWMTENLVPFSSLLEFTTTSTSGYLLITKDNPSGLPQNDASVRISVRFLNK